MNIMVTGGDGQLGRCLAQRAEQGLLPSGLKLRCLGQHQLDITDAEAVNATVRRLGPGIVINAAAWTDVDGAERHVAQAMAVNALGAANVAAATAQYGSRLFHISTDYVFDGTACHPLDEAAEPRPVNVYGASKLAGEVAVRREAPGAVIVRTSWLYSAHGRNFLKTILHSGLQRRALDVVDDQTGCPTSADDLADALVRLAQRPRLHAGVYHYSGKDAMTWFDFASRIVECAARHSPKWADVQVRRAATSPQRSPAPRPAYSVLSCEKISALDIPLSSLPQRLEPLVASMLKAG